VKSGKLVLLGVTQEQHADRCRLFAQWKGFQWPTLHDPINVFEVTAVPLTIAIDEHGIVRSTRPQTRTFQTDFLDKNFANDATNDPPRIGPKHPPDFDALRNQIRVDPLNSGRWLAAGDALVLWGGRKQLGAAVAAYNKSLELDPKDGRTFFRLGVCLRQRYESADRKADDFAMAVANWGKALELDPNQYIWRRRIQQYGPRLDKPYPFYDWVPEAEQAIRDRGEKPIELKVRPGGAEIAAPSRAFPEPADAKNPDPTGKVNRDTAPLATAEVVVVHEKVKPGQAARVHVTLRVQGMKAHWNNEAEPLRMWIDPPEGWRISARLLTADQPAKAETDEPRTLDFEVKAHANAKGTAKFAAFAVYHVCDDTGTCRFLRLDVPIEVKVGE